MMAALDKARPNLPVKPLPNKKGAAEKEEKTVRGTKAAANSKNAVKKVSVFNSFACVFSNSLSGVALARFHLYFIVICMIIQEDNKLFC